MAVRILALTTWVAATSIAGCKSTSAGMDPMMSKAMANMQKLSMLAPEERQKHVMDAQQRSLERGHSLFGDATLGTNGFSCATCHPGGATTGGGVPLGGMQVPIPTLQGAAATFPKFKVPNDAVIPLEEMNNNCVVMFMKGPPLPLGGDRARDLAAYVTSLSDAAVMSPGKQGGM